jgi:hypothetical protein
MLEHTTFQELDLFVSIDKGRETATVSGPSQRANLKPLSKGPNRVDVSLT